MAWLESAPADPRRWGLEGTLIHPALVALATVRERMLLLTPAEALDVSLAAGNVLGTVTAWGRTSARVTQRRANIEALRGFAHEYEALCATGHQPATSAGFILWCQQLASNEEDAIAVDQQADAVRVVTWHGAKGLEWPVVICADLEAEPKPRLWDQVLAVQDGILDPCDPLCGRSLRFWPWPFGGQVNGVPLATRVDASAAGAAALATARREDLRLLYVGFTRARDLLILTTREGKQADWLRLVPGLRLPVALAGAVEDGVIDGRPYRSRRVLVPDQIAVPPAQPEYRWFPAPLPRTLKVPAYATPSAAQPVIAATVGSIVNFGNRLPLRGAIADREGALGNALHAILAAELLQPGDAGREQRAERILQAHDVAPLVATADVLAMVDRFRDEILRRFGPARVRVEVPFDFCAAGGQRVSGVIDLLIESETGCVILDHKSYPGPETERLARALSHSGQLQLCRDAAVSAGSAVNSLWIHFSIAGALVEICL